MRARRGRAAPGAEPRGPSRWPASRWATWPAHGMGTAGPAAERTSEWTDADSAMVARAPLADPQVVPVLGLDHSAAGGDRPDWDTGGAAV